MSSSSLQRKSKLWIVTWEGTQEAYMLPEFDTPVPVVRARQIAATTHMDNVSSAQFVTPEELAAMGKMFKPEEEIDGST